MTKPEEEPQWVYQCPNCKKTYTHWYKFDYPPTHKCKDSVNRIYSMKLIQHP